VTPVAVVVLTHERPAELARTVARLRALPERPRVVVVDNASSDGTAEILARRFPDVEVVALAANVGAAGRNAGVLRVDAPYVAFCDDDTWWAPGSLARAATLLDVHEHLALVTGRVLVGPEQRVDPTCLEMRASPLPADPALPGTPVLGFLAAATMVRRSAFLAAGGFEARFFLGAEEQLLAIDLAAAGWALAYVDDIVIHHHPSARRDAGGRRGLLVRNALWCAWLRRPLVRALAITAGVARQAARDGAARRGLVAALGGLGWIVRRRQVVPPAVEAGLRRLERRATRPGDATPPAAGARGWASPSPRPGAAVSRGSSAARP
jgi:GT2 family glycosyltransferase